MQNDIHNYKFIRLDLPYSCFCNGYFGNDNEL